MKSPKAIKKRSRKKTGIREATCKKYEEIAKVYADARYTMPNELARDFTARRMHVSPSTVKRAVESASRLKPIRERLVLEKMEENSRDASLEPMDLNWLDRLEQRHPNAGEWKFRTTTQTQLNSLAKALKKPIKTRTA